VPTRPISRSGKKEYELKGLILMTICTTRRDRIVAMSDLATPPILRDDTLNPLTNRPQADACGFANGLRRPPALHLPYDPLSTKRRQPGILIVHPVLLI
jgi:hypothetical protein